MALEQRSPNHSPQGPRTAGFIPLPTSIRQLGQP
uniref:Uncharacterized protein n=1 Tax=Anguilla anguilla TaxID=7936 RepID=A0A0E9TDS3_ANGAN